jgi:uncharacterized protein (TIGR02186 family)
MRLAVALVLTMLWALPAFGQQAEDRALQAEVINIGVSSPEIAIAPDFAGTDVTVFGAIDHVDQEVLAAGGYDIVVALEGPRDFITIRKKERVFGVWVNRRSVVFEWMPESFSMASTRALESIANSQELATFNVGLPRVRIVPSTFSGRPEEVVEFRDAFLNLKLRSRLYQTNPGGVSFISSSLFQANIHIPADIPNGTHVIRAVLFKNGMVVAEKTLPLQVLKTGLEEMITQAATERPLFYGIFAVLLAVVTGWLASLIFRKE